MNVGTNPINPEPLSSPVYPLAIRTNYTSGNDNPNNGFGNGLTFRFSRGTHGSAAVQGRIACVFRSGANSGGPCTSFTWDLTDDNSIERAKELYQKNPTSDGKSVLVVRKTDTDDYAQGVVECRTSKTRDILREYVASSTAVLGFLQCFNDQTINSTNINTTNGVAVTWLVNTGSLPSDQRSGSPDRLYRQ